ncbi:ISAs1 family transposase [Blastochloris viridis]|uniref:Mobile element protein n=1 Tax=Blastochloris viridis TaxID=1079 RepID=A0A0H5BGW5_BLAVI|nr:ISAs1 family transposase [Blastochloris viridis]ALK10427.1 Transposase DDE domain protein [Blastochloris viridis]BAR99631.1 mobile element protein [Blastochloris viridis]CUU43089.1 Transposase [Blastochloris viridis]
MSLDGLSLDGLFVPEKSRLKVLLDHLSVIEDPREAWRVAHPLPEVLLLVVCGTLADCDDYEGIAEWGETHLSFLRRFLPYHHGVPGARWLTLLMNRIDPDLFAAAFTAWVRESWPDRPDLVAIDGKTSRRSHDRGAGKAPLHLVSAFATTRRLVLGQEAVADKSSETTAIPLLIERLAAAGGLDGTLISIDAIATNPTIATAIRGAKADYLLAVKANQPTLRAEIESFFAEAPAAETESVTDLDKGHGRIESRTVTVAREVDWLKGDRRFPGELRLPDVATIVRVASHAELADRGRFETRYYISSAALSATAAAEAVRSHWAIENSLHWVLDVTFGDDQSRLRTGHGARNMAVVRHFAFNLLRAVTDKKSLRLRRKRAGWDPEYCAQVLGHRAR